MIQVTASAPRIISDRFGGCFPFVTRLQNGDLLARFSTGLDIMPKEAERTFFASQKRQKLTSQQLIEKNLHDCPDRFALSDDTSMWWVRSKDNGVTWEDYGAPMILSIAEGEDGALVGFGRYTIHEDGKVYAYIWKSEDHGASWDGPLRLPLATPPVDQRYEYIIFHRTILSLGGGTFLVMGYTRFQGDTQDRVVLYRTQDSFKTLHFYSTVAHDFKIESRWGLDEGDFTRTPDGRLLCVMRTAGYLPMYQCWSDNDGATWTPITRVGMDGVDPALECMQNGIVACSYGRPGVHIAFSRDSGVTWQGRHCLYREPIPNCGLTERASEMVERSCCYTDIEEIGENRLLMLYCAPKDYSDTAVINPWIPEQLAQFRIWAVDLEVTQSSD